MNIPRNWFKNARPLPLDSSGRVDFSKDQVQPDKSGNPSLPAYRYAHNGWPAQAIELPAGHVLLCLIFLTGNEPRFSVHEENHNIFRLDADGNLVWQVRRDERGAFDLEAMQARAKELGIEGGHLSGREPFMDLIFKYVDGTTNMFPQTGTYPETDVWVPGCTIHAGTISGHGYVIDIDIGIATNVTGRGRRAW